MALQQSESKVNTEAVISALCNINDTIVDKNTPERSSQPLICSKTLLEHFQDKKIHTKFKEKTHITVDEFQVFLQGLQDNATTGKFHEYVSLLMAYYSAEYMLNGFPPKKIGDVQLRLETRVVCWLKQQIGNDSRLPTPTLKITTQEQVVNKDKRYFDICVDDTIYIEVHENRRSHDGKQNDRLKKGLVGVRQGLICYFKQTGLREDPLLYPEKWYQDTLFPLISRSLLAHSGTSLKKDADGTYQIVDDPERQRKGEAYRHKLVSRRFVDTADARYEFLEKQLIDCEDEEEKIQIEYGMRYVRALSGKDTTTNLLRIILEWKEKEIKNQHSEKSSKVIIPLAYYMKDIIRDTKIETAILVLEKDPLLIKNVDYLCKDYVYYITWKTSIKLLRRLPNVPRIQIDIAEDYLLNVQDIYEKEIIPEIGRNYQNIMKNVFTETRLVEKHIYTKSYEEATRKANDKIQRLNKQIANLKGEKFLTDVNIVIPKYSEKADIMVRERDSTWKDGVSLWNSELSICPFEIGTIDDKFSRLEFENICKKLKISIKHVKQMINIYTGGEESAPIMRYVRKATKTQEADSNTDHEDSVTDSDDELCKSFN